ncbi:MAG: putative transcriptional regulator [Cyclobacteriaceae bacterium]|jgi:predicted transcriptional regulator
MDLQAEKINHYTMVSRDERFVDYQAVQSTSKIQSGTSQHFLISSSKTAIDQGLESIADGKTHTHKEVMQSIKDKDPSLN